MRILWLSHDANLDGAERCLLEGATAVMREGAGVRAVLPPVPGPLASRLEDTGVSVSVIPNAYWMFPRSWAARERLRGFVRSARLNLFSTLRRLLPLIESYHPDVLVSNTATVPAGALAAYLTGTPHVWYIHELCSENHGLRFYLGEPHSARLIDKLSERVIVPSRAVMAKFERLIPSHKLRVVYCGVEAQRGAERRANRDQPFTLTLVGYISAAKRQEDAIRALSILAGKGLRLRLNLIGHQDSVFGPGLRGLVQQLGLNDRVQFLGFQENPMPFVAAGDLALTCSINEAFGRVAVEAMQVAKPVVGANSAGTAELIRDGWNGLLYEPGNHEALASRIERLYNDPVLLARMGRNAREWATQAFSISRYRADLMKVFQEAIESRPTNRREAAEVPRLARAECEMRSPE